MADKQSAFKSSPLGVKKGDGGGGGKGDEGGGGDKDGATIGACMYGGDKEGGGEYAIKGAKAGDIHNIVEDD